MIIISQRKFLKLKEVNPAKKNVRLLNKKQIIKKTDSFDYCDDKFPQVKNLIEISDRAIIESKKDATFEDAIIMPYLSDYINICDLKYDNKFLLYYLDLYKKIFKTLKEIYQEGYVYPDIHGENIMVDKKFNHMFVDPVIYPLSAEEALHFLNLAKLKILNMLLNTLIDGTFYSTFIDDIKLISKLSADCELENIFGNLGKTWDLPENYFFEREIDELIKYESKKKSLR